MSILKTLFTKIKSNRTPFSFTSQTRSSLPRLLHLHHHHPCPNHHHLFLCEWEEWLLSGLPESTVPPHSTMTSVLSPHWRLISLKNSNVYLGATWHLYVISTLKAHQQLPRPLRIKKTKILNMPYRRLPYLAPFYPIRFWWPAPPTFTQGSPVLLAILMILQCPSSLSGLGSNMDCALGQSTCFNLTGQLNS